MVAEFASDKKAENIIVLDMHKVTNYCDYFVICTGNSDRQVKAIAEGIEEQLEKVGMKVTHKQADKESRWILLDLGSVIAHIFERETRDFYGLEHLWQEAKKVNLEK